jgi:transcriptional regulator with GAF, ATPase, and Fis domain
VVEDRTGGVLGELGRMLVVAYQVPQTLQRLCSQLTGMLPITGCWAVILDELDGQLRFVAATDPVARRVEALHAELGEGPCLRAAQTGERVLLPDLAAPAATERFPRFAAGALAAGIRAVYSFPLCTADQHVGGLSLCNAAPAELDDVDLELAQLLASLATSSIVGAHRYQQVTRLAATTQQKLTDVAVLEQAKGRLSVQLGVDPDSALGYLRRYATGRQVSVQAAAAQVATGRLRLRGRRRRRTDDQ